jgi:DNA modification methylase
MGKSRTRQPQVRIVPISKLILDDKNANKHTKRGKAMLEASLKKLGAGRSVLVDKENRVIAGNATVEQARALGMKQIAVIESDGDTLVAVQRSDVKLNSKKGRELAIADNRVAEVDLGWDANILQSLEIDLSDFWNDGELKKIGIEPEGITAPEPKLDKAAELQRKWGTKRGHLWLIGQHRLLCGDSTSREDVARLWANVPDPDGHGAMMATDPPYGVSYGVDSGADSAQRFGQMTNDAADGPKLQAFLESAFHAAIPFLRPNAAWYLWHAQLTQGFFAAAAAAAAQLLVHRQIIWVKNHFIMGHGDYHWQHELCFYGWRQGHRAKWHGDRSESTAWAIDRPSAATSHPTEKPAELFARSMRNSTESGEVCYEPFAGSGTQLCAAESSGRRCYAIEIEPKYIAVALERMADMGLKPKLAHG